MLLRTESIASSKVEGLQLGVRDLARAEARADTGETIGPTARQILANIDAMELAIDQAATAGAITPGHLVAIHKRLMSWDGAATSIAGWVRTTQNWLGGNDYSPCGADFVPPPPEEIVRLTADLCRAINDDTLPPVAQAAVVHAQFETIHPFRDGNGRTGRALIHLLLRRRGLARQYLTAVDAQAEQWRAALSRGAAPRADAAAWAIIDVLPAHPMITGTAALAATGRARAPVYQALEQLEEAGVLKPASTSKRNRVWEAVGLLALLEGLEAGRVPA